MTLSIHGYRCLLLNFCGFMNTCQYCHIYRYRSSGGAAGSDFSRDLVGAKASAVGAAAFFAFLLFIIVDFCAEEAVMGWFTDWSKVTS
jgi:hypothetical protein